MVTAGPDERVRGLLNFRSLPLPQGAQATLYRSGDLTSLPPETARTLSKALGVSAYIDLRTEEEVRTGGAPAALCATGVRWVRSPINGCGRSAIAKPRPGPEAYVRYYLEMMAASWMDFQKALLAVIRHGRAPLVFGCFAGKDRTGLLSAAILEAAGQSRERIVADYAATGPALRPVPARFDGKRKAKGESEGDYALRLKAQPGIMTRLYAALDANGGGLPELLCDRENGLLSSADLRVRLQVALGLAKSGTGRATRGGKPPAVDHANT